MLNKTCGQIRCVDARLKQRTCFEVLRRNAACVPLTECRLGGLPPGGMPPGRNAAWRNAAWAECRLCGMPPPRFFFSRRFFFSMATPALSPAGSGS